MRYPVSIFAAFILAAVPAAPAADSAAPRGGQQQVIELAEAQVSFIPAGKWKTPDSLPKSDVLLAALVHSVPKPAPTGPGVIRICRQEVLASISLEEFANAYAKELPIRYPDVKLDPGKAHKLGARDAWLLSGTSTGAAGAPGKAPERQRILFARRGGFIYWFEVVVPAKIATEAMPSALKIEQSWKWLGAHPAEAVPVATSKSAPNSTTRPTTRLTVQQMMDRERARAATQPARPRTPRAQEQPPPAGFKRIVNAQHGIVVDYPAKWTPLEGVLLRPGMVFAVYPGAVLMEAGGVADSVMMILDTDKRTIGLGLQAASDSLRDAMSKEFNEFKLISEEDVKIDGVPARRFVAEFDDKAQNFNRWNVTTVIHANKTYRMIYSADVRDYDKWSKAAIAVIDTARWLGAPARQQPRNPAPPTTHPASGDGF